MDRPTDQQIVQWYPRLYRSALRLTGDQDVAADLTQQTFFKGLQQWGRFEGLSQPTTWLHRILINTVHDWRRRQKVRQAEEINDWTLAVLPDDCPAADAHLDRREQLECLRKTVVELPEPLRATFVATILDGYSYRETAEMLSVPVGTVASRVFEARRIVSRQMRQRFGSDDHV